MFTGIITDIGTVQSVDRRGDGRRLTIATTLPRAALEIGASVACAGVCLTVVEEGEADGSRHFSVDVSEETERCTMLEHWVPGTKVNLEAALRVGDSLGGHFVTGHVDGIGTVVEVKHTGENHQLTVDTSPEMACFIARKGSIAMEGVSLTVNEVNHHQFGVNIIPHTWDATTLSALHQGASVHLEIDVLARYAARFEEMRTA